jgi:acetyl esterase/lipase
MNRKPILLLLAWLPLLNCRVSAVQLIVSPPVPGETRLPLSTIPAKTPSMQFTSTATADPFLAREKMTIREINYTGISGRGSSSTHLDLYRNPGGMTYPVVLYVHGGAWSMGDKGNVGNKPDFFHELGFHFISINYRMLPEADVATQAGDIASAVAWTISRADEYAINPGGIFLMGHSAGAHLVSLVGTDESYLDAHSLTLNSLAGVISLDTQGYDLPSLMQSFDALEGRVYRRVFGNDPENWSSLSPFLHVESGKDIPPFLVVYSGAGESRNNQSADFVSILQAHDVSATLIPATSKTHAQVNQEIGQENDPISLAIQDFLFELIQPINHLRKP